MITDHELLQQALAELARLKPSADDPLHDQTRLYSLALADWADRLEVSPIDLKRLVLMREAVPEDLWRQALQTVHHEAWAPIQGRKKPRSGRGY